ncbi:hypothetical protein [Acidovorax sp. NCPPB 3576]|uniref:hypothetical protein n=1 Tax=Acidovorax sp. NCPPB 3576 TaxID=2940488 RepID=UPI00234BB827|nr:hypothetical protein [Acidovorax sp. NCPPB 3576]WCM88539.1 hypothetical protein M5C98_00285 [Acidovorax sp. NCPPB 3576]
MKTPTKAHARAKVQAQTRPEGAVEPAQYDRMRAPVWTTNPAPATRAGANDHRRIDSRSYRC